MSGAPEFWPALPEARVAIIAESAAACSYAVTVQPTAPTLLQPSIGTVRLPRPHRLQTFDSSWGTEYEPRLLPVDSASTVEVTAGRSTQGGVPWLSVETDRGCWVLTLHWSGNWRFDLEPVAEELAITVGLHPDTQRPRLRGGEAFTLPTVSVGWGPDRAAAAAALVRHLARPTRPLPVEWNHWWPYEDAEISEEVFLAEAEAAAGLGFEIAVLDAGWFGRSDAGSDWVAERGDWHRVNTTRFPHGLRWLADQTRARGLEFGIWIEAEALGPRAVTAADRPALVARNGAGESLGYVCLGSRAGRDHVAKAVGGLLTETGARWLKWDFNLDPGAGCSRPDHGHDADDGLLRHYTGLYQLLDQLRDDHPDTVIEGCSSGGLRIDAGLAEHVDALFLSDPDWTEHHLTCLWGAAGLLAPGQMLHWPESEWRTEHRFQKVDYSGSLLTRQRFDTKVRAAMLHRFGVSIRLTEMRADLRQRLAEHVRGYADHVRPLLDGAVLVPLTEQPLRNEQGHRQPAFCLCSGDDHLLAGFRLPPVTDWRPVQPYGLDPTINYRISLLDGDRLIDLGERPAAELITDGLTGDPDQTSMLWRLTPAV